MGVKMPKASKEMKDAPAGRVKTRTKNLTSSLNGQCADWLKKACLIQQPPRAEGERERDLSAPRTNALFLAHSARVGHSRDSTCFLCARMRRNIRIKRETQMHTHTGASVGRGCKAVCVCEEHPEKSNLFNEGKV